MNKIKKILLTAFSLFLIISINQTIFADITNHKNNIVAADFSKEWQKIRDKKSVLEVRSTDIIQRYPKYESAISGLLSHLNTLEYTGFIQPLLDMPAEQKEDYINDKIQLLDKTLSDLQITLDTVTSDSVILPKEIKDFFGSTFRLLTDTCQLARQELVTRLAGVKTKKIGTQKYIKPLWTTDELKKLTEAASALKNIKDIIDNYPDNPLKPLLQSGLSTAESYIDLMEESQEESYNIAGLRNILEDLESTIDAHSQTKKWLEQLQTNSPEIVKTMIDIENIVLKMDEIFKNILLRTIDKLEPQDSYIHQEL